FGDQKAHGVGDVVGRAEPAGRNRLDELAQHGLRRGALGRCRRLQEALGPGGLDAAGRHAAHANVQRAELHRQVLAEPARTVFMRMFSGPSSIESSLLNMRIAALHALPGVCSGIACWVVPVMLTMTPPPRRRMCGTAAFAQRMSPSS